MSQSQPASIFPLTTVQQALLINTIRSGGREGVVQVEAELVGELDPERLQTAWATTIQRQEALRSTIHWKDLERPVQVVRLEYEVPFEFQDWSGHSDEKFQQALAGLKTDGLEEGLDVSSPLPMRFVIIRRSSTQHLLLWTCHHLLLDGWSSSIVLGDLLRAYSGNTPTSGTVALTEHNRWLRERDRSEAERFWRNALGADPAATILGTKRKGDGTRYISRRMNSVDSESLRSRARENGTTLSATFHAAWSLLLGAAARSDSVCFGTTASGRSGSGANLVQTAGMFATVLPVPVSFSANESFDAFVQRLQREMASAREFEFFGEEEVCSLEGVPAQLFDSLIVFENIPAGSIGGDGLALKGFRSGVTTSYALTLAVRPGEEIEFDLLYREDLVSPERADWFADNLSALLQRISGRETSVSKLTENITVPFSIGATLNGNGGGYYEVKNPTELAVREIWEEVLGFRPIGTRDDFFDLGGRSLAAVRIFSLIKERLGFNFSPVTLLECPTIESLSAAMLNGNEVDAGWSTVVRLRRGRDKAPLFCLHAGGGHVMFYRSMISNLDGDQPVFGVQPVGIDGEEEKLETVEEMARLYIDEIKKVQPNGPYSFLGYCFSSTVAIEIARQLIASGDELGRVIIVDSPPMHMPVDVEELPGVRERMTSYLRLLTASNWKEIGYRLHYKMRSLRWKIDEVRGIDDTEMVDPTLAEAQEVLSRAYKIYEWKPFPGDLTLMLAGPLDVRPWAKVIIEQWKSLVEGDTDVHIIEADHTTIFDEPDVRGLAAKVQQVLDDV